MEDQPKPKRLHASSRFIHRQPNYSFDVIGNTSAKDYLESVTVCKEPSILLLSSGDVRGCVYTLWKHFDPAVSVRHFTGVHFVLNDHCVFLQARSVLWLYLVSSMPTWKDLDQIKQQLSNLWSILYCHELLSTHEECLREALGELIRFSASLEVWISSLDNPLHKVVTFASIKVLAKIREIWQTWKIESFGTIYTMHSARKRILKDKLSEVQMGMEAYVIPSITTFLGVLRTSDVTRDEMEALGSDFTDYFQTGSSYAEDVFNLPHSTGRTFVNPTLFQTNAGKQTLEYASSPFGAYFHILELSMSTIQKLGLSPSLAGQPLVVDDESFARHPLLSNSVQQFAVWMSSVGIILRNQSTKPQSSITFTFNSMDDVVFCEELKSTPHKFVIPPPYDIINASHLFDTVSVPGLVYATLPLLKPEGLMFCWTRTFHYLGETTEEFLTHQFGFSAELIPVILGARCIGSEIKYHDNVSNEPRPLSIMTILGTVKQARQQPRKELVWCKVNATPMKLDSLSEHPVLFAALYNSIRVAIMPFMEKKKGIVTRIGMCIETGLQTLIRFASLLDSEMDVHDYRFWEPVCHLLREDTGLKPVCIQIQTLALLHNLHLHLLYTPKECPLCLGIPVLSLISQFSTSLEINPNGHPPSSTPFFSAVIYHGELSRWLPYHLMATLKDSIQIFDSIQGEALSNSKVKLDFFIPNAIIKANTGVKIVRYDVCVDALTKLGYTCIPTFLQENELHNYRSPTFDYKFKQAGENRSKIPSSKLGTPILNWSDADHSEMLISLSQDTFAAMKSNMKLMTKRHSATDISVCCGDFKLSVAFPFPVDYSKIVTKLNKKKGTLLLKASRISHQYFNERAMFMVNPDNKVVFPPMPVSDVIFATVSGMQLSSADRSVLEKNKDRSVLVSHIKVKEWIVGFMKAEYKIFTVYSNPDPETGNKNVWVLIVVHSRVYDVMRQTPAIDISFCIIEPSFFDQIFDAWRKITAEPSLSPAADMLGTDEDYYIFSRVLLFFGRRTYQPAKCPSVILRKHQIHQYFTRAMVYPIYCDTERFLTDIRFVETMGKKTTRRDIGPHPWSRSGEETRSPIDMNKFLTTASKEQVEITCSQCGLKSDDLKKCTGCGTVQYCGRTCQAKHWKKHKADCKPQLSGSQSQSQAKVTKSEVSTCSSCDQRSSSLRRCACHAVSYCSKECQRIDWTFHRLSCTAKKPYSQ